MSVRVDVPMPKIHTSIKVGIYTYPDVANCLLSECFYA